jgi:hypothetical protein
LLEKGTPTRQQFDDPDTAPVVIMRNPIAGTIECFIIHHALTMQSMLRDFCKRLSTDGRQPKAGSAESALSSSLVMALHTVNDVS